MLTALFWLIVLSFLYGALWFIGRQYGVNLNQKFREDVWPVLKKRPMAFALGGLAVTMFLSSADVLEFTFVGRLIVMVTLALIGWFTSFDSGFAKWGSALIALIGVSAVLATHEKWDVMYSRASQAVGLDPVAAVTVTKSDKLVTEIQKTVAKKKDESAVIELKKILNKAAKGEDLDDKERVILAAHTKVSGEPSEALTLGKYTNIINPKTDLKTWYWPEKCCFVFRNTRANGSVEYFAQGPDGFAETSIRFDGMDILVIQDSTNVRSHILDVKPTLEGDRKIRFQKK